VLALLQCRCRGRSRRAPARLAELLARLIDARLGGLHSLDSAARGLARTSRRSWGTACRQALVEPPRKMIVVTTADGERRAAPRARRRRLGTPRSRPRRVVPDGAASETLDLQAGGVHGHAGHAIEIAVESVVVMTHGPGGARGAGRSSRLPSACGAPPPAAARRCSQCTAGERDRRRSPTRCRCRKRRRRAWRAPAA